MQNIFDRVHDDKQANESLMTCMDVAAITVSRNKFCYLFTYVKYRWWNKSNEGMHMEIQLISV